MRINIAKDFLYEEESYKIRGAAFEVWKTFRGIFKEKIVDRALKRELENRGLKVENQKKINIYYKDEKVGIYVPDFVVNDKILIEIKVKPFLTKEDERQFWYYLKGSQYRLGFLINFGSEKLEIRRRIYDKAREKYKRISVNQRIHQRQSASIKAFTIIEMLVIIGILSLLSATLILYSRTAENQIVLFKEQARVISALSRAKSLAIATYGKPPVPGIFYIPCGYGVHFEAPSTFLIFKDLPTNSNDCSSADKKYSDSTSSELVESFQLDSRVLFDSLSLSDILFIPPDPKVVINPSQDEATIAIKTIDGSSSVTIKVTGAGQITTSF